MTDTSPRDVLRRTLDTRAKAVGGDDVKPDPPLHWPSLTPIAAERAWPQLRRWVEETRLRYPGLDSYVIPNCWYEHESLVMALQAMKDHERAAYAKTSPASAGTDWHRAFRDLSALLRQFTADLRCSHGPERTGPDAFEIFQQEDIARRRRRAATVALGQPETIAG